MIRRSVRRFFVLAMPVAGGWLVVGPAWFPWVLTQPWRVPVGIALIAIAIVLQVVVAWIDDRALTANAFRLLTKDALLPLARLIAQSEKLTPAKKKTALGGIANYAVMSVSQMWMAHVSKARAIVYLMDEDESALRPLAHGGRGEAPGEFVHSKGPASQGAIERVRTNRTLIVKDMKKDPPPGFDQRKTDYRSFISVPIVDTDGYGYGMINVDSPKPRAFKEFDKHILMVIAQLLAIAMASAYQRTKHVP